jgi:hypothetical protein
MRVKVSSIMVLLHYANTGHSQKQKGVPVMHSDNPCQSQEADAATPRRSPRIAGQKSDTDASPSQGSVLRPELSDYGPELAEL